MALEIECCKCRHKMQVAELTAGQRVFCAQCKVELICLVGGATVEAAMEDLKLQPLDPSAHLSSRKEIKARNKSSRPAWQMPAQRKGKMKRIF